MPEMNEHRFYSLDSEMESALLGFYDKLDTADSVHDEVLPDYLIDELNAERSLAEGRVFHAAGGSKDVFKVKDRRTARTVALAKLKPGADAYKMEQFLNEARITAILEHPNIIPIYDIGLDDNNAPFFSMKFLHDQSLDRIISELGKGTKEYVDNYSRSRLLDIFVKVCEAVAYAHSHGIVHLDLKPANIMIGSYGEVYVCDWGLAKVVDGDHEAAGSFKDIDLEMVKNVTLSGSIKGTPGFMAPEQIDGSFGTKGKRTDIFALGAILYMILTYRRPYSGSTAKSILALTLKGRMKDPKEISSSVPESLNAVVLKAMSVRKHARYLNVTQIINEIRSYQDGFATKAQQVGFFKSLLLFVKRHKIESLLISIVLFVVAASFAILKKHAEELEGTLALYEQEKLERREQLIKSAPALVSQWKKNFVLMDLEWLHMQLDELIELRPNDRTLPEITAYLFFSELKFDRVEEVIRSRDALLADESYRRLSDLISLCRESREKFGYIKVDVAMKCLKVNYFAKYKEVFAKMFLGSVFAQIPHDEEKGLLVFNSLNHWGNRSTFSYKNIVLTYGKGTRLDLSNTSLLDLEGIEFFPITALNLSGSSIREYMLNGNKYIKVVNFSGCRNLRTLKGLRMHPNLQRVVLPAVKKGSSIENYLQINKIRYKIADK